MRKAETTEITRLKARAHKNPSTTSPLIRKSARRIISAFTTKAKSPNVSTVIGRVRIERRGLITRLSAPKTIATIIAVIGLSSCTPGNIYAATIIDAEEVARERVRFIYF